MGNNIYGNEVIKIDRWGYRYNDRGLVINKINGNTSVNAPTVEVFFRCSSREDSLHPLPVFLHSLGPKVDPCPRKRFLLNDLLVTGVQPITIITFMSNDKTMMEFVLWSLQVDHYGVIASAPHI